MAWNNYSEDEEKVLIYDLRQTYAEIVGTILKQIALARITKNYVQWYDLLDDLHTEINQKLKKEERERYREVLKNVQEVLIKNSPAYLGSSKDGEQNNNVKLALKHLEMFLKYLMEKHKMFGAKETPENL